MLESYIRGKYQIEFYKPIEYFLTKPVPELYKTISGIKRDEYSDNYRIVFVASSTIPQDFVDYLQKILTQLDIPNFFVLIIGNRKELQSQLKYACERFSPESTSMQFMFNPHEDIHVSEQTNFKIPETICINPWINIEVANKGTITPCCNYNEPIPDVTVNTHSIVDVFSGDYMKKLRTELLAGKLPSGCSKCFSGEQVGAKSKRMLDNYVYRDSLYEVDWNEVVNPTITSLDVKLGITCNLACRICAPHSSSSWVSEVKKNPSKFSKVFSMSPVDWVFDEQSIFWKDFDAIKNTIRYMEFSGGEPLMIKKHFNFLQRLIDSEVSHNISLHYNTNGTVLPLDAMPIWNKFKKVGFSLSIDNVGKKFEYERYGSTWEHVDSVVSQFAKLVNEKFTVDIYCVLSALNVADVKDIYNYAKTKGIQIEFGYLSTPEEFDITILTPKAKHYIIEKLSNESGGDVDFINKISPIVEMLGMPSRQDIGKFFETIENMDSIRNQKYSEYYPDIYTLLKE